MENSGIPSPYNFGDIETTCDYCNAPAFFIYADKDEKVEIYECKCGGLHVEKPFV